MTGLDDVLRHFNAQEPVFITKTNIATLYKTRHAGHDAALKIYHNDNMQDEAPGFTLLQSWTGPTAKIYGLTDGAALMEWLGGPSLGDMARDGNDQQASEILGQVARQIHAQTARMPLPTITETFRDLLTHKTTDPAMIQCIAYAQKLLHNQTHWQPLHGDLHHDNIKQGPRGYTAFDAKGIIGPPAYDYAQAFFNPIGMTNIYDPALALNRAQIWGQGSARTLLQWAAAKCALSHTWNSDYSIINEKRMIDTLLTAITNAPADHA